MYACTSHADASSGFITEREFGEAEAVFPGIEALYESLARKPSTFLDLLQIYLDRTEAVRLSRSQTVLLVESGRQAKPLHPVTW
jgi:hypothetical protein